MLYSSQGKSLTIWKIILTTIVTLIVALRFEAARIKRRTLRLDDYFLLVAYVGASLCHCSGSPCS